MNKQPFDPLQVSRYTVICVYHEYPGQPGKEHLFVVLRHDVHCTQRFCWCIRATSQVQRFSTEILKGCVFYKVGESLFEKDTVVDPSNIFTPSHNKLNEEAAKGRYRIIGKMPDDFHGRLVAAIRASRKLEPKKKAKLLEAIGESLF